MTMNENKSKLREWAERWWKLVMLANVIGGITLYLLLKYNDEVAAYLSQLLGRL